jgi:MFS family permease
VAQAAIGYVIYGLGAAGPYLRTQLGLSDAEVGLHSTALAVGLVVAGALAAALGRRFGQTAVRGGAIAAIGVALPILAATPSIVATLGASLPSGSVPGRSSAMSTRRSAHQVAASPDSASLERTSGR